ncbi:MAG: hypothetical protein HY426_01505 [Candidatus Levybacteria bacterium]|nr:hypothetical protein [Candidatus Levybacteria bacterium]
MFFRKNQDQEQIVKLRKKQDDDREWDKRRILFALCIAIAAIVIATEVKGKFYPNKSILGDSTKEKSMNVQKPDVKPPNINLASGVGSKINEIKQNINGLNVEEVASSSPQIQKVLRDIQGIKDLPSSQAREMCLKICSGI